MGAGRGNGRRGQEAPCARRWGGGPCRAVNQYWIFTGSGDLFDHRATCACGRRIATSNRRISHARSLLAAPAAPGVPGPAATDEPPTELWPADRVEGVGRIGCVPVGTPVLHAPTRHFTGPVDLLRPLTGRLLATLSRTGGIGLAANQVGADIRVLVHGLADQAPGVLVNAELLSGEGWHDHEEGCLSLNLPGSRAMVGRPRRVLVRALTPAGHRVLIQAGDYLARVLQHEIDHLDGIEYVQRLTGSEAARVYRAMEVAGLAVDVMPPAPYAPAP
ncbi:MULTISPECIES: peptide deformylase [Streptomyces]|uniref:peptide deformylase n=1 Tax=Streptomyces scabiei TaxID=1930 RepID=UPI00069133E9|nr:MULTISPECIES: peptide deformylase [Streptomyces]MDW8474945.1 peptide deformylase [Streptomyces scabiei]MDX2570101.1 peptide deformylase [Streptomyces scabiei]MDX2629803.1 peptide deformylase [Streptomyces scabiei]MDX2688296.1 peptide deformylase [Streptomyces scabiei]MDX2753139.1 peptide deformylase [Streptomyces scabiei]